MKLNLSMWSLKTRITLFTLLIFVLGIWSLSFYASRLLERDIQNLLADQQVSTASFVAAQINDELSDRMQYLQVIADSISPAMLRNTVKLQTFLQEKKVLQIMFNGGAFIVRADGTALADVPLSAGRTGINYKDRDFTISALDEGKATISSPIMGRKLNAPIISMTMPIKDNTGKVIGALLAVTNLGKPNFLDKVTDNTYGKTGGYVLLIPGKRLIVTATDKSRIMQALPARGVVPTLDRFLDGYEGSAVYVNPLGVEVLGSAKGIPVSDWLLGVTLPITEAFAPIREMQRRMLAAALALTLLAAVLTWWMLRRQLSPMLAAVQHMSTLAAGNQPPQALPVTSQDEIGTLIAGFNRLLETLAQRAAALRESDGRAATLIETSPLPLALNDEKGNITYLNQAFIKTIGYTLDDIPTLEQWWPLAYPDPQYRKWVADHWRENLDHAMRTKQPFAPLAIDIKCKDGSLRTFMASASAFEGGFSKTHLVILYDITESKKAEQALIATTNRLNDAQRMARIGNWTLNLPAGELIWSDEIFNMFEIDPAKFGATYEAFLNAIHPDDREAVNQAYASSLVSRKPYEITHRLLMRDGRIKWVVEKCMSDFDAAGKPLQSRGMVQDITAAKLTELALIAARDEADRANAAKSQFLSSMSHELRTPLNAILGYSQLMEIDNTLSAEYKENAQEILKAGYHLLNLINEVLDLSKIETGNIDLSLEPVLLDPVIDECVRLISTLADKHGIRIRCSGLKGAALRADRTRLKQALLNLLSNAVKYNREGGSVHLEIKSQGSDRLRILVHDSGHGIPAGRLAEVFQPFNRLDAQNGSIEGTGIGLTITRRIVEMMGGQLDVESDPGAGSTFWIELPIEHIYEQGQDLINIDSAGQTTHAEEERQHVVLYIEDNPSNLRLMAQILGRRKQIRLLTAHTPELGLELAMARHPALILLDINMPGMDGYEVLKALRSHPDLAATPVIAVTANAMTQDIESGLAAGFNDYVTKPIDIPKLSNILERLLPTPKET